MKKTAIIIFTIMPFFTALCAETLTLENAVKQAFESNLEIKNALKAVDAAKSYGLTAGTFLNPEAFVEVNENNGKLNPFTYGVSQEFEQPGVLQLKSLIASNLVSIEKNALALKSSGIYLEVVESFYGVGRAKQKVILTKENLEYMRRLYGTVELSYRSGKLRQNDLQRAKISVLEAEKECLVAENDLENQKASLNILMGLEPEQVFDVVPEEPVMISEENLAALMDAYASDSPVLKQAALEADTAGAYSLMEELKRLPSVTAGITLQKENGVDNYTGTIGFNMPLWNLNQGEAGRAGAEYEAAKNNLELVKRKNKSEISAMSREIKLASKSMSIAREAAISANELIKTAQLSFQEGKLDLVGYLDQMKTAFESKSKYYEEMQAAAAAVNNINKHLAVSKYFKEEK